MKNLKTILALTSLVFIASSCADPVNIQECVTNEPSGFWNGLLHGIIAPFTWLLSLFMEDVSMYDLNNNGGWYNFGFLLGVGMLGGGTKVKYKKKKGC